MKNEIHTSYTLIFSAILNENNENEKVEDWLTNDVQKNIGKITNSFKKGILLDIEIGDEFPLARKHFFDSIYALISKANKLGLKHQRKSDTTTLKGSYSLEAYISAIETDNSIDGRSEKLLSDRSRLLPVYSKSGLLKSLFIERMFYNKYDFKLPEMLQKKANYKGEIFEVMSGYETLCEILKL